MATPNSIAAALNSKGGADGLVVKIGNSSCGENRYLVPTAFGNYGEADSISMFCETYCQSVTANQTSSDYSRSAFNWILMYAYTDLNGHDWYYIVNRRGGQRLQFLRNSDKLAQKFFIEPGEHGSQLWRFESIGEGTYRFRNWLSTHPGNPDYSAYVICPSSSYFYSRVSYKYADPQSVVWDAHSVWFIEPGLDSDTTIYKPDPTIPYPEQLGWKDETFVCPNLAAKDYSSKINRPNQKKLIAETKIPFWVTGVDNATPAFQAQNTPFYYLRAYRYWKPNSNLQHDDYQPGSRPNSDAPEQQFKSTTVSHSTTNTTSSSFSHTTGVQIEGSVGVAIKGISASVKTTVSQQWGFTSSITQSLQESHATTSNYYWKEGYFTQYFDQVTEWYLTDLAGNHIPSCMWTNTIVAQTRRFYPVPGADSSE